MGETVPPDQHFARVADHAAWLTSGRSRLASADLIWPRVEQIFADMRAVNACRRAMMHQALEQHPNDPQALATAAAIAPPHQPIPLPVLMELKGFADSYLLMAGYAVENFLKAVRVKRLTRERKPIRFKGPDRIPSGHKYVDLARIELGDISDAERQLLDRLAVFVRWAGRYPVSKEPPTIEEGHWVGHASNEKPLVDALCQRLIQKYESIVL